jgi:hypothetical protein
MPQSPKSALNKFWKTKQNARIESFNGKFKDECFNEHPFLRLRPG